MSESRPHLTTSLSFAGSPSASVISRPLKPSLSEASDLNFFTPAAQSFKPRPYTPNGVPAPIKPLPTTRSHSTLSNIAQHIQAMDPSPTDPLAVFIHPPFNHFPNSHLHPEGISYALMAANPEWFLDPADFISTTPKSDGGDVISYPPQLEPPRGWCPAKKKDLRALGAEGWPEGEEPRLRCTFCRRTYAGVNAKSMWRRHVYEKHKIAMANRREGSDRSRGRASNSKCCHSMFPLTALTNFSEENRHPYSESHSDDGGRRSMKLDPTSPKDNYDPLLHMSSSRFCSHAHLAGDDFGIPSAPYIEQTEFPMPTISVDFSQAQLTMPSITPPLTPHSLSPKVDRRSFSEPASPSPKRSDVIIPQSPYNPLRTPSFRHSPPRLPSDQPWRFPSPSHPLHSRTRELYLGTIVRGGASPSAKDVSLVDSSPISMLNTPAIPHKEKYNVVDSDNVDHLDSSPIAIRPSPHSMFGVGPSAFPSSSDRIDIGGYHSRVDESPLGRLMRRKNHNKQKSGLSTFSDISNDWFPNGSIPASSDLVNSAGVNGLLTPIRLGTEDPFTGFYSSWVKEPQSAKGKEGRIAPLSSPSGESPVLRNSQLHDEQAGASESNLVGLGIGLMPPFTLTNGEFQTLKDFSDDNDRGDFDLPFPPSPEEEHDAAEVDDALAFSGPPGLQNFTLRRAYSFMSCFEDGSEPYEPSAPPTKRRRTRD
jgi:hypothetical protein